MMRNTISPDTHTYQPEVLTLGSGVRVAYLDEGQGDDTLVFVHGMASNLRAWRKNVPQLRHHFRCISLDLPGYGQSSKENYSFTMPFFADVLHEFLVQLGVHRPVLVGHSMGGQVVLRTLLDHSHLTDRAILVAPAGIESFTRDEIAWLRENYTADFLGQMTAEQAQRSVTSYFHRLPDDVGFLFDEMEALRTGPGFGYYCDMLPKCVLGMVQDSVHQQLAEVGGDLMVLYGAEDALIPHPRLHAGRKTRDITRAGVQALAPRELSYLTQVGHFLQWEASEKFNEAVLRFLI